MKVAGWILACASGISVCSGLSLPAACKTRSAGQDPAKQAQSSTPEPSSPCFCDQKKPGHTGHSPATPKPTCDSCDCEKQKAACSLALVADQAIRSADLGRYYLESGQYGAAFAACQGALKLASALQPARDCELEAIRNLQRERKGKLQAILSVVDARLSRGEVDEAFSEIALIRSDLAPPQSPLGEFDEQMNADVAVRLSRAKWTKWFTWISAALPILFWTILKILAVIAIAILAWRFLLSATSLYFRHKRYRTRRLDSEVVDWVVWSIRDAQDCGCAGPVMDALNPNNNPLLNKALKPSSLLLVPKLAAVNETNAGDNGESLAWRDFLDPPREAIDMEILPLESFQKHRFIQIEAFDELDIKVGAVEAKGIVGLLRTLRKWLDRGLPAAQGTVYSMPAEGIDGRSYACVRITCNWTTELQALSSQEPPSPDRDGEGESEGESKPGDETLSVFASSVHDPSIDAVALSAQRAAFKLFHRLVTNSSPTYSTAVANFHQGIALIDEYI
jgi:hypothetical protein